jgi:hypothetical protein
MPLMKIPAPGSARRPDPADAGKRLRTFLLLLTIAVFAALLTSCLEEGSPIDKPDAYTHVYEAGEKYILRAVARVFREKDLGKPAIHADRHEVTSDWVVQGEWRTRSVARVRGLNRRENEVTLSVINEKLTSQGWEMRRLLGKEQYDRIFHVIETRIYEEMYRGD